MRLSLVNSRRRYPGGSLGSLDADENASENQCEENVRGLTSRISQPPRLESAMGAQAQVCPWRRGRLRKAVDVSRGKGCDLTMTLAHAACGLVDKATHQRHPGMYKPRLTGTEMSEFHIWHLPFELPGRHPKGFSKLGKRLVSAPLHSAMCKRTRVAQVLQEHAA